MSVCGPSMVPLAQVANLKSAWVPTQLMLFAYQPFEWQAPTLSMNALDACLVCYTTDGMGGYACPFAQSTSGAR